MRTFILWIAILFTCYSLFAEKSKEVCSEQQQVPSLNDKKERNLMDLLYLMMDHHFMIDSDYNEDYDIIPNKSSFIKYTNQTDTTALVLIKNRLNHTIHRLVVEFDSVRVKKMWQYSVDKENYDNEAKNTKWKTGLNNSFIFEYDDALQLKKIKKAYDGSENLPFKVKEYNFNYIEKQIKTIEQLDNNSLTLSIAYYGENARMDSIYTYANIFREKTTVLSRKFRYTKLNKNQVQKDIDDLSKRLNKISLNYQDSIVVLEKTFHDPLKYLKKNLFYYKYENGLLASAEIYDFYVKDIDEPLEPILDNINPLSIEYFYNENNQVVKQVTYSSDSCHESTEIVNYSVGDYGFVLQTTSTKTSRSKCIY